MNSLSQHTEQLRRFFAENSWSLAHTQQRPGRPAHYQSARSLKLNPQVFSFLDSFGGKLYKHQFQAIQKFLDKAHTAITTPTASGKTLIFQTCALELLARDPQARIAAIYPLKALACEQEERWQQALRQAGISVQATRIDGDVHKEARIRKLRTAQILIFTPDILHAWLLSNLSNPHVQIFLRHLRLIILDEAHTYSGVFGSNAAYLLRRVLHAIRTLGGDCRFIAASATMKDPQEHLKALTGENFEIIDSTQDTSPQNTQTILCVNPPSHQDFLKYLQSLIDFCACHINRQFIVFLDSRKQTEYLATIVERSQEESTDNISSELRNLETQQIYPYRSGYEADDRQRILEHLQNGTLRGVISTSALEMGIDIPHLSLGILWGVPRSATSFIQRIGRIGRKQDGLIIIVNNHSLASETIFRQPEKLNNLPLTQSSLYLDNPRIQYIHAMCLAAHGGENDMLNQDITVSSDIMTIRATIPHSFSQICMAERLGELSQEMQMMKSQAGNDPHHTFPLRDLDMQFKVEMRHGPDQDSLGTLSHGQVMREAYPGAVYYYQKRPYRIIRIHHAQRLIEARPEKQYFTYPKILPRLILPNLKETPFCDYQTGALRIIECPIQIGESIVGFKEKRGSTELDISYPLDKSLGFYFDLQRFSRYFFTSGILLHHPSFNQPQVQLETIAHLLCESFCMITAFDAQDIYYGADKFRSERPEYPREERFIALYDQTYGSLRLTSRICEEDTLRKVLSLSLEIAQSRPAGEIYPETLQALQQIFIEAQKKARRNTIKHQHPSPEKFSTLTAVIKPGSYGIDTEHSCEFYVERVFFHPQYQELCYRGRRHTTNHADITTIPIHRVTPLENVSQIAYYDPTTADLLDNAP